MRISRTIVCSSLTLLVIFISSVLAFESAMPLTLAATASVDIVDFSFSPSSSTINLGDSVTWTNRGPSFHTSTSDSVNWNSSTLTVNQTFSFTFNSPGSFTYHCNFHPSMIGTIVVQSAATATATPVLNERYYVPLVLRGFKGAW